MAEPSFLELLLRDFPWPTKGDRLFSPPMEPMDGALIERDPQSKLVLMVAGYKLAADLIIQHTSSCQSDRDLLIYPVLFCYRHYIELSLKSMLAFYGPKVGVISDWSTHNLEILWQKFKELVVRYGAEQDNESINVVKGCIAEIANFDPASFDFRYPRTRKGEPISIEFESLDLDALNEGMGRIHGYFTGVDGQLYDLMSADP
jgi:hypothetical protein